MSNRLLASTLSYLRLSWKQMHRYGYGSSTFGIYNRLVSATLSGRHYPGTPETPSSHRSDVPTAHSTTETQTEISSETIEAVQRQIARLKRKGM